MLRLAKDDVARIVLPAWHFASKHGRPESEIIHGNPGDIERIQMDSCQFFHEELGTVNWMSIESEVQHILTQWWSVNCILCLVNTRARIVNVQKIIEASLTMPDPTVGDVAEI